MSKIYPILEQLFQSNGANPNLWGSIKDIVQNQSEEIIPFCILIKNKIVSSNKEDILLALYVLDYVVDYGRLLLWTEIDKYKFLECFINILKYASDADLKNCVLYLIQKWAIKFQNYPAIQNCKIIYNNLRSNNIIFPNNIKKSYLNYISGNTQNNTNNNYNNLNNMNYNMNYNNFNNNNYNIKNNMNNNMNFNNINNNNNLMKMNYNNHNINNQNNINVYKNDINNDDNSIMRQSRIQSNPNDYIKTINLDLNPSSYEKKYYKLVNKLNEWMHKIQEINILIDNNINNQHNQKLKTLYDELKSGNESLVSNIESPKLKDEKLMKISLNVCEDMVMTFNRCEKSMKGENPGPFLSSFTRDDNPNGKKNKNNIITSIIKDDFKYEDPMEKINKLGFGDTICTKFFDTGEDNTGDGLDNSLSGLFDKLNKTIKLNEEQNTDNNKFFTNMSNSNINFSIDNINYQDYYSNNKKINGNGSNYPINNIKIADNYDIKRLINNNAYEKNLIKNKLCQTQKFPTFHLNLNVLE